jgi:hypothetical protein
MGLVEPQSGSGRFRKDRNLSPLPVIELLFHGLQSIAYVTKIIFLFGFLILSLVLPE